MHLDIPKSDILTMFVSPTRQFLAARSLLNIVSRLIGQVQIRLQAQTRMESQVLNQMKNEEAKPVDTLLGLQVLHSTCCILAHACRISVIMRPTRLLDTLIFKLETYGKASKKNVYFTARLTIRVDPRQTSLKVISA